MNQLHTLLLAGAMGILGVWAAVAAAGCASSNSHAASDAGASGAIPDAAVPDAAVPDAAVPDGGSGVTTGGSGGAHGSQTSDSNMMCPLTKVFSPPCNSLAASGPLVRPTCSSLAAPQAQGGTIMDGIYFIESSVWYGSSCQNPPAPSAHSTWILCGGLWDNADDSPDSDAGTAYTNYEATVEGTTVVINPICASQGTPYGESKGFTASGNQLILMTTYGSSVIVNTYALQ